MSPIYPYAGFWRRAAAFLVDSFIIGIVMSVLYIFLLGTQFFKLASQHPQSPDPKTFLPLFAFMVLFQILGFVFFWLYFACQESGKAQATLGKKVMGIKVVGADGGRIGFWRATGRTLGKMVSNMTLYFGYYMAGFTQKRQALHDLMADTYVVRDTYQPGDEKPLLRFSAGGLIASILAAVAPVLLMLASLGLLIALMPEEGNSSSPEDLQRQITVTQAKAQMFLFSMEDENKKTTFPLEKDGISYSKTAGGYRAEFTDENDQRFVLETKNGNYGACCAEGDCEAIDTEPCN